VVTAWRPSKLPAERRFAVLSGSKRIPVIVVTGETTNIDERDYSCVLRKSIDPDALALAVPEVFAAAPSAQLMSCSTGAAPRLTDSSAYFLMRTPRFPVPTWQYGTWELLG
jgi:hypothetical protein